MKTIALFTAIEYREISNFIYSYIPTQCSIHNVNSIQDLINYLFTD